MNDNQPAAVTNEEVLKREFLSGVPGDQSPIGNKTLRTSLIEKYHWDEEGYWRIHHILIEDGTLIRGKGKGGSVHRSVPVSSTPINEIPSAPSKHSEKQPESDLYEPIANVIENRWAREYGLDFSKVEIVAHQGSKQTGGAWTRPDIVVAGYKTFTYLPDRYYFFITFEIKKTSSVNVVAVYEALAHRRASTHSFVLFHIPKNDKPEDKSPDDSAMEEVILVAEQYGIGIISAEDIGDSDTWEVRVEATRHEPDPVRLNSFLMKQLSKEFLETIVGWYNSRHIGK